MLQLSTSISEQRTNRRLAVRLPLTVSGRDSRGVIFREETSSENLCRSGAAFVTRFDLSVGCDVEIHIPIAQSSVRRKEAEADFTTRGRVVHVESAESREEKIIGVQFIGPHFRRMFLSESAA
jgi:PilZ domain